MLENNSIGIVAPQIAHFSEPFTLKSGAVLPQFHLVYETYGTLNADKSNAILALQARFDRILGDHVVDREMLADIVVRPERGAHAVLQEFPDALGPALSEPVKEHAH